MDYIIKNDRNCYIRLDQNGTAASCPEFKKGLFDETKAKNILKGLPKTLKKMGFRVEAVPEISPPKITEEERKENFRVLQGSKKATTENVTRWIEIFGQCYDNIKNASKRYEFLEQELGNKELELLDILHNIELRNSLDMFGAWKVYKAIKTNRELRRNLKDEMLIIGNVLKDVKPDVFSRERTEKAINGLFERKYRLRIVEEDDENDSM